MFENVCAMLTRIVLLIEGLRMQAVSYRPALLAAEAELQASRAKVAEWLLSQAPSISNVAEYVKRTAPKLAECEKVSKSLTELLKDPRVRACFSFCCFNGNPF